MRNNKSIANYNYLLYLNTEHVIHVLRNMEGIWTKLYFSLAQQNFPGGLFWELGKRQA